MLLVSVGCVIDNPQSSVSFNHTEGEKTESIEVLYEHNREGSVRLELTQQSNGLKLTIHVPEASSVEAPRMQGSFDLPSKQRVRLVEVQGLQKQNPKHVYHWFTNSSNKQVFVEVSMSESPWYFGLETCDEEGACSFLTSQGTIRDEGE